VSDIEILFHAVGEHLWRVSRRPPQMTFRGLMLVGWRLQLHCRGVAIHDPQRHGRRACRLHSCQAWRSASRSSRSACNQNSKSRPAGRPLISHSSLARARTLSSARLAAMRSCSLCFNSSTLQPLVGRLVGYARSRRLARSISRSRSWGSSI